MASEALLELRDALRQPIPSTESLASHLSVALSSLDLHPTSVPASSVPTETLRAIQRYLPTIQLSLLNSVLPNLLHALDSRDLALVDQFFCPRKSTSLGQLRLAREIANVSYLTLPGLLSVKPNQGAAGLPLPCRDYILSILGRLAVVYGIDDLYWSIWRDGNEAEGSKDSGMRSLKWEEVVKAATSLPAKVANAAGRWASEGWKGVSPTELLPR